MGFRERLRRGVLTRSRALGWFGMGTVFLVVAVSPFGFEAGSLGRSPFLVVGFAVVLFEALWRFDFRPKVIWNDFGVTVVGPWSAVRVPWVTVGGIEVEGNVLILRTPGRGVTWEFDRPLLLAAVSQRYRDRGNELREGLREVWRASVLSRPQAETTPAFDVSRPWYFWAVACSATACGTVISLLGITV